MEKTQKHNRILELRNIIHEANRKYYIDNAPVLSDYDFDMLLKELEALEKPIDSAVLTSRMLVYNDPLIGMADAYLTKIKPKEYYHPLTEKLGMLAQNKGEFAEAFIVLEKLSALLELKADYGIRLRKAYLSKDMPELMAMAPSRSKRLLPTI